MHQEHSLWTQTAERPRFEPLKGDKKTDVLIVGGGMAGLLCAYMLKNAGVDCLLVEADQICSGITQNTTAKITLQHGLIYNKMIQKYGFDRAKLYLQAQQKAMEQYKELCKGIDCDYQEQTAYVYSRRDKEKVADEAAALRRLGIEAGFTEQVPLPLSIQGAVYVERQAQFHPLKFAFGLAGALPVYENTKVWEIGKRQVVTEHGKITAEKVIVATHFPIINKHGGYFLKLYQHRSYVLALENVPLVDGMYVDEDLKGLSFRNAQGKLLLGGGGHRTGKQGGAWFELEAFARKHYPGAKIVGRWAAQDCMSLDGMAYVGRYSPGTPNLFVATGFNKWGMTSSMASAMILKDLVQGKSNDFAEVFAPNRSMLHQQLAVNAGESLLGLLTPTRPRCPHMGCALHYNPQEHSWDCSCHGSRFTAAGQVIDNPATDEKKNMGNRQ